MNINAANLRPQVRSGKFQPSKPPEDNAIRDAFDDLPKYPRAALWGVGCISPALVGGALGGWEGALVGGAATAGFRHEVGGEAWTGAAVGALLPTAFGVLLPSTGNPLLKAGLGLALGALGGLAAQMQEER